MLTRFYHNYCTVRALAVLLVILFTLCAVVKGHCWTLDMHPRLPGGEEDRMEEEQRKKENEKAYKRTERDKKKGRESKPKDKQKAEKHKKEMARWKQG